MHSAGAGPAALIPDEVNRRRGPGIPGVRNVDHIAITVPDLDQAVRFFVEALGACLLYVEGPIAEGTWMTTNLNVPADARCMVAMLRLGPVTNLELFEYDGVPRVTVPPRNSDVGGHHLAFYVDDIDAAHAYVRHLPGVVCQGVPKTITSGPLAGDRWLYFTAPWGLQLELISLPASLPYEAETRERRYGPYPGAWHDAHAHAHADAAGGATGPNDAPGIGIALPVNRMRLDGVRLRHIATALEASPCRTLWVNDHLATFPAGTERYPYSASGRVDWNPRAPQYEAMSTAAFLAAVTRRVGIGTAALVLPQRHPVEVAKTTATLADLSDGRFLLGVGAGWSRREMRLLDWDPATRGSRMDEQIGLIRACWGTAAAPGMRHYRLPPDAIFEPRPRPGQVPPILIAGVSPAALDRVRRLGDGWLAVAEAEDGSLRAAGRCWRHLVDQVARPLYGVLKVPVPAAGPETAARVLAAVRDDGWDEVCFEFAEWDLDDVRRFVDASVDASVAGGAAS